MFFCFLDILGYHAIWEGKLTEHCRQHIEQYLDLPLITGRDMLKARTSEHKNGFLGHKKNYSSEILNDVCTLKT